MTDQVDSGLPQGKNFKMKLCVKKLQIKILN